LFTMFESILKPESLSTHVETELTKAIRQGKYQPLQKLPTEHELCSIFRVSRTVIREAIRGLSSKGIVKVKKGSGVYVSEMSIQNASETLNLFFGLSSDNNLMVNAIDSRALIEPMIVAKSALVRTENHINRLHDNMNKLSKCPMEDKLREAELDSEFHRILLESIENPVLHLLMDPIFSLLPRFKRDVFGKAISGDVIKEKRVMLEFHKRIIGAVVEKRPKKAQNLMREHLKTTLDNYIKSLNR